jgi:hypothetical protein
MDVDKDTIVIIGNGFDLAHGLKTSFKDFIKAGCGKEIKKYYDVFYSMRFPFVKNWYNFERFMEELTNYVFCSNDPFWFYKRFEGIKWNSWSDCVNEIEGAFSRFSNELIGYLSLQEKQGLEKNIPSVRQFFSDRAWVVNFNYTNTAEYYTDSVYYIHGSIKENDIIVGYDSRYDDLVNEDWFEEPETMDPELTFRNKRFLRQSLDYRRFLRKKGIAEPIVRSEGKEYLVYLAMRDADFSDTVKDYSSPYFKDYITDRQINKGFLDGLMFDRVRTVVIMGHSLLSDQMLIRNEILKKCLNLNRIVLFSYKGEKPKERNLKSQFLNNAVPDATLQVCCYQ